jgi:NitT/TauT family transport system permease protein
VHGVGDAQTSRTVLWKAARLLGVISYPLIGLVAFVALWWIWIETLVDPESFLADWSPRDAVPALWELLREGDLNRHVIASVKRIVVGLTVATALGAPLGIALGSWRWFNLTMSPITAFVRMVSPLSWTPLAIILFGVGDPPVYFLTAIGAMWPIALSTSRGVSSLDPQWLMLGRSLGATRIEAFRTIVWPGIKSDVLNGLRLGMTTAWIILVPAEMLGVDSGLGFFILDARDRFNYPEVVAAIIVIGFIGLVLDRLAQWLLTPRRRMRSARVTSSVGVPVHGARVDGQFHI